LEVVVNDEIVAKRLRLDLRERILPPPVDLTADLHGRDRLVEAVEHDQGGLEPIRQRRRDLVLEDVAATDEGAEELGSPPALVGDVSAEGADLSRFPRPGGQRRPAG
jgi:hypothetical protein